MLGSRDPDWEADFARAGAGKALLRSNLSGRYGSTVSGGASTSVGMVLGKNYAVLVLVSVSIGRDSDRHQSA